MSDSEGLGHFFLWSGVVTVMIAVPALDYSYGRVMMVIGTIAMVFGAAVLVSTFL